MWHTVYVCLIQYFESVADISIPLFPEGHLMSHKISSKRIILIFGYAALLFCFSRFAEGVSTKDR